MSNSTVGDAAIAIVRRNTEEVQIGTVERRTSLLTGGAASYGIRTARW